MNQWHRSIVIALVICIGILPVNDLTALAGDTPSAPAQVKQQIDQFGVGANLKVQLADGKKVKGSVVSLGDTGFELRAKPGDAPRHIAYNNVNEVKLAKLIYHAKGAPDAIEARRVVLGLGVGHHIQVRTTAGKEYHGNIQVIDANSFSMLPDRETTPVQIAFSDVQYVEQNLSKVAGWVILGAIVGAVVIVLLALRSASSG
jgi:small nuclear ribonucleoprotein (snRNP)-like protein